MTDIWRTPYLQVLVNDVAIPNAMSYRAQHGFDLAVASADADVYTMPTISPFDKVEIIAGATLATATTRFLGYYVETGRDLYPATKKLLCKGHLIKAQIYQMYRHSGLDLTGSAGDHHGETDQGYTWVILENAGLTDPLVAHPTSGPGGYMTDNPIVVAATTGYPALNLAGTNTLLGSNQPTSTGYGAHGAFWWQYGETAQEWLQRIDAISLGYRTYDAPDGSIKRSQVSMIPAGSAAYTFTEGVDIFRASTSDTVLEAKNYIVVTGYSDGQQEGDGSYAHHQHYEVKGTAAWFHYGESGSDGYVEVSYNLSSPMLEKSHTADPPVGISCEQVGDWLLAEYNVRRLQTQLWTPRDDPIIPGTTIQVQSSHLGLTNKKLWVQQVQTEIDNAGHWMMTLNCLGVI